jgi:hypothetical protein
MADWSRREVDLGTEVQWIVPTNEPWGACWNEVMVALRKAVQEYQEMYGLTREPSDDAIRVFGDEEKITIKFMKKVE